MKKDAEGGELFWCSDNIFVYLGIDTKAIRCKLSEYDGNTIYRLFTEDGRIF